MHFFSYYDPYYWVLLFPAMLIALVAQIRVNSAFNRFSQMPCRRGLTGAQAAEAVLAANGVTNVTIQHVQGHLSDHYDPRTNVIRLSDSVYGTASVSAVGVAAHEAGHAVQYAKGYSPIKLRAAIIPLCSIGSQFSIWFIIIGLFLYSQPLFGIGVILFSLTVLFQLVTLPVEFDASRRAVQTLERTQLLEDQELWGAKKVLSAAALTYVAALLVSLAQLLRFILAFNNRRRD